MSLLKTRTVSLSVALLLASTSLASAGFIWLSPENPPADNGTYSRQAEPAAPAEANGAGRAWEVDPAVPVMGAPAPAAQPVEVAPVGISGTSPVVPMQMSEPAPVLQAQAAPVTLSGGETITSQPIYSPGDQDPAVAASSAAAQPVAPMPVPADQPVEMMATAPAVSAPTPDSEVTLASTRDLPQPTPALRQGGTAASAMPGAEAMINSMPSMTAPRSAPPAPAADTPSSIASAPLPAPAGIETAAVSAPSPAPAENPVVPMLSPATVPMQVAAAPAPAPQAGSPVSMVTGQPMSLTPQAPASAPAPVETAAAAPENGDKVISGFGKHVPLVIAMRQILPSGYGFAHGDGVDLTAAVDWQGGRPWPQVLSDAISPIGLTANISGETVMLQKAQGGSASAPAPAPVAMAPAAAPQSVLVPTSAPSAPVAPGQAILTNATVMQAPPSNN